MVKLWKPMLAASTEGHDLHYPVLVSPKLDGIRATIQDGTVLSRSLKPIPNHAVQLLLGLDALNGLDGELVCGDPTHPECFNRTTSVVMSKDGYATDLRFYVFDDLSESGGFERRLHTAKKRAKRFEVIRVVDHYLALDKGALTAYEHEMVEAGYEGIMIRDPIGRYKNGRSTQKEGGLLKMKRFHDAEAVVVGLNHLRVNVNDPVLNTLGYQERSTKQQGMITHEELVGSLIVKDVATGVVFGLGTGFSEAQRQYYAALGDELIGKVVKYKSQPAGAMEKPRFPVFIGFRDPIDL
jgi:DNA ligase-1